MTSKLDTPDHTPAATSRLTIDIDAEVHKTFKALCARKGLRMADEVRRCIEMRVRELEKDA